MRDQIARRRIAFLENQILDLQEVLGRILNNFNNIEVNTSLRPCGTCSLSNVAECSLGKACPHGFDVDEGVDDNE